jgi:hypothetical protein
VLAHPQHPLNPYRPASPRPPQTAARYGVARSGAVVPTQLEITKPANFLYGRKDCASAPRDPTETAAAFPTGVTNNTAGYFSTAFGFTAAETTAIMGGWVGWVGAGAAAAGCA